jgi:hypothetical protein
VGGGRGLGARSTALGVRSERCALSGSRHNGGCCCPWGASSAWRGSAMCC